MTVKRRFTNYYTRIRSRHPSHDIFRKNRELLFPFKSLVRLGSTTASDLGYDVEINSVQACYNSGDKKAMKECFLNTNVKTADWYTMNRAGKFLKYDEDEDNDNYIEVPLSDMPYPIVAKSLHGSRGLGNYLLNTQEELTTWLVGKTLSNYIFEKFYNYSREYRIHTTKYGAFYSCRKMLKRDTPEENRWYRNDSNCVWVTEYEKIITHSGLFSEFSNDANVEFDKPSNWDIICEEAKKALVSVGLSIGGIDVKVQSRLDSRGRVRENPEFIILETNSAPSMGEITGILYTKELRKLIQMKYQAF